MAMVAAPSVTSPQLQLMLLILLSFVAQIHGGIVADADLVTSSRERIGAVLRWRGQGRHSAQKFLEQQRQQLSVVLLQTKMKPRVAYVAEHEKVVFEVGSHGVQASGGSTSELSTKASLSGFMADHWRILTVLIIMILALVIFMAAKRIVEFIVLEVIEYIDVDILGVDIHIGSLWINLMPFAVHIANLSVDNPVGYKSKYLLKADMLQLHIDAFHYIFSLGRAVNISSMFFDKLTVTLERSLSSTNIKEVIHFLYYGTGNEELPPSGREYSLKRVDMEGVELDVLGWFGSYKVDVPIGPIHYDDFGKEMALRDVLRLLLRGMLHAVLEVHYAQKVAKRWKSFRKRGSCCAPCEAVEAIVDLPD